MSDQWQRWRGIMKAYPFEEKRLAKWSPPYIVQPKYDGDRCRNDPLPEQKSSFLLTSEENIFFSVPHINEALKRTGLWGKPFDGELYNHELYQEGGHELIHSIVSRTKNLHPDHKQMEFWVFDLKYKDKGQMTRLMELSNMSNSFPSCIRMAPFWVCSSLDEIKKVYDNLITGGYEGIIVRHLLADYRDKRSIYVMKFKPKRKDIYKIVGFKEEISMDGVPKGRIGSLTMSSQSGDIFSVSAGLDHDEKQRLWEIREMLPGLDAMVHYQHLTNKKIPKGTFDIEIIWR